MKTYQHKDNKRDVGIRELEERLHKFKHGSKLELLAQLAMLEIEGKDLVSQSSSGHIKTPTRPTVVSLGVELWKRT